MKAILPAAILALGASPALAHSAPDATAPENGAVLAQAPPHIVLTFAKRIRLTRVRMTGPLPRRPQVPHSTPFARPGFGRPETSSGVGNRRQP